MLARTEPQAPPRALAWASPAERDHQVLPVWRAALYASPSGRKPLNLRVGFEVAALADRDGTCSPSNETLGELAQIDTDRARDAIAELERDGLINRQRVRKSAANATGRRIVLTLPKGAELPPTLDAETLARWGATKGVENPPTTDQSGWVENTLAAWAEVTPTKHYQHRPRARALSEATKSSLPATARAALLSANLSAHRAQTQESTEDDGAPLSARRSPSTSTAYEPEPPPIDYPEMEPIEWFEDFAAVEPVALHSPRPKPLPPLRRAADVEIGCDDREIW